LSALPKLALVLASSRDSRGFPILDRLNHLRARGWDAELVCGNEAVTVGVLGQALVKNPVGLGRCLRVKPTRDGLRPVRRIEIALTSQRPGVVHFDSAAVARACLHLKAALGFKVVVSLTGEDLNMVGLDDPDYYRDVWRAADRLHVPDESLWRRALRRGCPPDRRRVVVTPAADTAYLDRGESGPVDAARNGLRILSVGPLVWAQGYEHALYAARLLLDRGIDFEYRIVGEGEHLPALTFARYQLGLEGRVELLSPGGPEALRSQLHWADVFLSPAVAEGFTEAVVEAHAMQLPVVASERGLLHVSKNADGALVVPRRDPHALSGKLAQVATDPALRRRLGERGRALAVEAFDVRRQLARFEELYREVV
jgi:glycosyltransferase involved in cell wall biosynthesis